MSAPNIINVTAIIGKSAMITVGTSPTTLVTNASNSNKVIKISQLLVTNVNTGNATVTVDLYRSSTAYRLAYNITVPVGATLDIISSHIYLEEGDLLRLTASSASYLEAIASIEEIS